MSLFARTSREVTAAQQVMQNILNQPLVPKSSVGEMLSSLRSVNKKLASIQPDVDKLLKKAREIDPNKRVYNEAMTQKVILL